VQSSLAAITVLAVVAAATTGVTQVVNKLIAASVFEWD
jgi:hypothetical protein